MPKTKKDSDYCRFYIVRHGETEWNVQKRLQGHKDSPLTENGINQAKGLANLFSGIPFDDIFSSDLFRAQQTAEIIATDHQLAVKTNQLLREGFFGEYEGKKVEQFTNELRELIAKREQLSDADHFTFDLGHHIEKNENMVARFITFLREVSIAYHGKNILVVTHGGMMRTLLVHLGFGTFKELAPSAVKNLGYFILESDGVDFFIKETKNIEKHSIKSEK